MSGVAIIASMLKVYAPLTAIVDAANIEPGDQTLNPELPRIAVRQISSVPNLVDLGARADSHMDRVQVSVLAEDYAVLSRALVQVIAACPNIYGIVNTFMVKSIVLEPEGPDLSDPDNSLYSRSRDFLVHWAA